MTIKKLGSQLFKKIKNFSSTIHSYDEDREEGISAIVAVRNEPWLEPAIFSIKDAVDEIIIVDSSTIDISKTIKKFKGSGLNIKYVHTDPDYSKQIAKAISLSKKRWILRWDGDCVAYNSGERDIKKLRDIISGLDSSTYYSVEFKLLQIYGDFFHTGDIYAQEEYLFNFYSECQNKKRFMKRIIAFYRDHFSDRLPHRSVHMPFPIYFKTISIDRAFGLHIKNIKSEKRNLERMGAQRHWQLLSDEIKKKKYDNSLQKYAEMEGKKVQRKKIKKDLDTFDHDHPEVLKKYIKKELGVELKPSKELEEVLENYLKKWS